MTELIIASRDIIQRGFELKFKILFRCSHCKRMVEPDRLTIGRAHIYALHCNVQQDIGCVA